ncbi:MAG: hypothetical protein WD065_18200 [Planctomycetaceae bacterium]
MSKLFVGNFDFEHQLRGGEAFTLPVHLRRRNVELSFLWTALAQDGDFILGDAGVDAEFFRISQRQGLPRLNLIAPGEAIPAALELCPWGWSNEMRQWGAQHRCTVNAPEENAVWRSNSRRFSFACERDWDVALPDAAEFVDLNTLRQHLRDVCRPETRWVIKAEFGMSARERILGQGAFVSANDVNWLQRRLARGQRLYFEPWVEKIVEAGLQFSIPPTGEPQFAGCTELLTDARGQYRGSRWSDHLQAEWDTEITCGIRVAGEVQRMGYFGPLGIDAMRYRDDSGEVRSRPIQDVNARWTMGRLALECQRFVPEGSCFSLLHLAASDEPLTMPVKDCLRFLPDYLTWGAGSRERLKQQVYLSWAETEAELTANEKLLAGNNILAGE